MSVAALHSPLDSYDVVYDGQEHDDTKSVSHLDWPFLIKVRFCEVNLNVSLHICMLLSHTHPLSPSHSLSLSEVHK